MTGGGRLEIDPNALAKDIETLHRKPGNVNADDEANYLHELITQNPSVAGHLKNYADPTIIGVGGSGIILRATYTPNGGPRALKFPRKRQYTAVKTDPAVVEIDPERRALEKVSHQNITRLYDAFELPNDLRYCMITEYVPGDDTLDTYVPKLVCNPPCHQSEEQLTSALNKLDTIVCSIAGALRYLHNEAKLLHFDIKPENILISPTGIPFVSDLGFERDVGGHKPDAIVEVGFTWKYAHPRLQDPHDRGARITNVPQKAKALLRGNELSAKFDVTRSDGLCKRYLHSFILSTANEFIQTIFLTICTSSRVSVSMERMVPLRPQANKAGSCRIGHLACRWKFIVAAHFLILTTYLRA